MRSDGKPTNAVIIGGAALLLGCVLFGIAIHQILTTGTCSTTGYTRYGPVPHCPKGVGWYTAFLMGGVFLTILAATTVGSNLAVPALFVAMGAGALLVGFEATNDAGGKQSFSLVFGGCFAVAGLGWAGIAGAFAWNSRPIRRQSPSTAGPVPAIAGLGPESERSRGGGFRLTPRPFAAVLVWLAALGGAIGLGALVADASTSAKSTTAVGSTSTPGGSTVDITRAALPRPTGASVIGATDPASLFKGTNLGPVLQKLIDRFGASGSVVLLSLYPGELEAVIADDSGNARRVTAGTSGSLTVSDPTPFEGPRDAVNLSQLTADVPPQLARQIAAKGGVPTSRLDRFVLATSLSGPLAGWRIYPVRGRVYFDSLLTGTALERVTPTGKHYLT
jgi:hypothetical protein